MAKPRARTGGRWILRSLASRLVLVSVVFIAVPILIYQQFRAADEDKQTLLLQSAQQQGQLIARALEPLLAKADASLLPRLGEELARFADENTRLKLLLRPKSVPGAQGFYYVGAAPLAPNANLDLERQRLLEQGILARLADTCSGNQPLAIRLQTATGALEVLTSITPINSPFGCWAVVTSHSTPTYLGSSIGQPYWQTPEVQAAALIYLAMAALVLLLFLGVWSNLRRFGSLARQIGNHESGRSSFADQNTVPELRSVAEDFDRLVDTLRSSADNLRRAAEDNAHAFKTPIAVIRQSLEPLKRIIPGSDGRGPRAIDMIDRSLDRLDGLVSFARRMDEAAADLLEPPRRRVDMSELLEDMLSGYANLLAERHLHLRLLIAPHVVVRAGEDLLETVVENIVENAISFSPDRRQHSGPARPFRHHGRLHGRGRRPRRRSGQYRAHLRALFLTARQCRIIGPSDAGRYRDRRRDEDRGTLRPAGPAGRDRRFAAFRHRSVDRTPERRSGRRQGDGEEPGKRRTVDACRVADRPLIGAGRSDAGISHL